MQSSLLFSPSERRDTVLAVVLPFIGGLIFAVAYYRVFHVARTGHLYPGASEMQQRHLQQQQQQRQRKDVDLVQASDHQQVRNPAKNAIRYCSGTINFQTSRPSSTAP